VSVTNHGADEIRSDETGSGDIGLDLRSEHGLSAAFHAKRNSAEMPRCKN